jgi:hypothetical protein
MLPGNLRASRHVQTLMRYAAPAVAAILLVTAAGCASSPPASPRPVASHPPRGFTDNDKSTGWIVGTVTAGGAGPCYGLTTDEGTQYALHSTVGTRLDKGARVQVQGTPAKIRINCGPGRLLEMTAAEPLR